MIYMEHCLARHVRGDWGVVCAEDRKSNFEALRARLRILSASPIDLAKPCEGFGGNTLWIITEADRSATSFCCRMNTENRLGGRVPVSLIMTDEPEDRLTLRQAHAARADHYAIPRRVENTFPHTYSANESNALTLRRKFSL
jgi:hypothetical protein